MKCEAEDREEAVAVKFRDDVYLHSIAGHIPGLYQKLYERPEYQGDDFQWEVPQSEEDVQRMMMELAAVGGLPQMDSE